jgi:hypothetical protein
MTDEEFNHNLFGLRSDAEDLYHSHLSVSDARALGKRIDETMVEYIRREDEREPEHRSYGSFNFISALWYILEVIPGDLSPKVRDKLPAIAADLEECLHSRDEEDGKEKRVFKAPEEVISAYYAELIDLY